MVHVISEPEHPVAALRHGRALVFSWHGDQQCSGWEWLCQPGSDVSEEAPPWPCSLSKTTLFLKPLELGLLLQRILTRPD